MEKFGLEMIRFGQKISEQIFNSDFTEILNDFNEKLNKAGYHEEQDYSENNWDINKDGEQTEISVADLHEELFNTENVVTDKNNDHGVSQLIESQKKILLKLS